MRDPPTCLVRQTPATTSAVRHPTRASRLGCACLIARSVPPQEAQLPQPQVCRLPTHLRGVHVAQRHAAMQCLPATCCPEPERTFDAYTSLNDDPSVHLAGDANKSARRTAAPSLPCGRLTEPLDVSVRSERSGCCSISSCCRRSAFLPPRAPHAFVTVVAVLAQLALRPSPKLCPDANPDVSSSDASLSRPISGQRGASRCVAGPSISTPWDPEL